LIDWLIDWLINWLNTYIAQIPNLSNAHDTWLIFWPVLRRCHILWWEWSSAAIGASFPLFLLSTLVHAGFCTLPQTCDLRTETAGSLKCVLDVLNEYTHWTSVYRIIRRTWESPAPNNWAPHTNSKILVPDRARTPNFSHWRQTSYLCVTGSLTQTEKCRRNTIFLQTPTLMGRGVL
jgi:hypothetical protein